jgi:hypothetical protein
VSCTKANSLSLFDGLLTQVSHSFSTPPLDLTRINQTRRR